MADSGVAESQDNGTGRQTNVRETVGRRESLSSQDSHTAKEFIENQLQLEADAREALPYSFDSCTRPLGPLRQTLFACITCNPPPANPDEPQTSAAMCYSCSISCHGEHTLIELFNKRNFICDCGTTRFPSSVPCTLRNDPKTKEKGVHSEEPATGNKYNQNFKNRFCGCGELYDAHKEKGTMFQCLGLGTVETGGCGEDWWHPECLIGLPRDWNKTDAQKTAEVGDRKAETIDTGNENDNGEDEEEIPLPPGFPEEDDFETFICYKCLDSNPWLKRYAGTPGFLPPVFKNGGLVKKASESDNESRELPSETPVTNSESDEKATDLKKRKGSENEESKDTPASKRSKTESTETSTETNTRSAETIEPKPTKHDILPPTGPSATFSLFLKEDFRDHFCRCPTCFPNLANYPQLREEEETYEPPLSDDGNEPDNGGSAGTGSIYDRGEAALSNIDRVRAIEGAMVYSHLRDRVKEFLKPFAETGKAVSADDVKSYFERLRGDDQGIRDAGDRAADNDNH